MILDKICQTYFKPQDQLEALGVLQKETMYFSLNFKVKYIVTFQVSFNLIFSLPFHNMQIYRFESKIRSTIFFKDEDRSLMMMT